MYLGKGWVLTATHVGGVGNFKVDRTTYSAVGGSGVELENTDGTLANLLLYKINVPQASG